MSIRRAAEEYGIPRTTVHNKVSGEVDKVVKSGPITYLTDEEECKLSVFATRKDNPLRMTSTFSACNLLPSQLFDELRHPMDLA